MDKNFATDYLTDTNSNKNTKNVDKKNNLCYYN